MTRFLLLCLCIFLAASLVHPLGDADLGWHIAAGRWAIAHRSLPTVDLWNAGAVGTPWMPYSWSSELLFAGAEMGWGWPGLLFLSAVYAFLLVIGCAWSFSLISEDRVMGVLLTALAVAGCQDHFDLRPQTLTWVFLALATMCGDSYQREKRKDGPFVFFLLVCCFWANSHITTVFAFLACAAWGFEKNGRSLLPLICAGFLGSLITPHLGMEWLVAAKKADHPFLYSIISEFQPATIWHSSAALVLLEFALLAVLVRENPRALPLPIFLLTVIFLVLGFAVQKFIPYAAILISAAIARLWRERGVFNREKTPLSFAVQGLVSGFQALFERASWITAGLALLIGAGHLAQIAPHPIDRLSFPVAAMDFVKINHLPGPILNDFSDGGYVMYRYLLPDGTPEQFVSLDGRTNVNNPKIMEQYINTIFGNALWKDYFNTIQPNLVVWRNRYALPTLLSQSPDWCRLYSDSTERSVMRGWSVFLKRGSHFLCPAKEMGESS